MAASSNRTAAMSSRAADAERLRQQLRTKPTDRIAWHNLAAAEGDLGRVAEAEAARGGSQLHLQAPEFERPLIAALFGAIGVAVRRHLAGLGRGEGPMRSRNRGSGVVAGAWSVRLRSGGFHTDHVHPHGWLSSACYIALPDAIGSGIGGDRAGWLRFGQPAGPTRPALAAEHFVRPEAGLLALFPAYMWHGVVPFEDHQPRLTVAFDVVPG